MHELDVTKELVSQLKEVLETHNIYKGEVMLELGKLTTYVSEPIRFYYTQLTEKDSYFSDKDIQLIIEEKEGQLECNSCGNVSYISDLFERLCPVCNSAETIVNGGNELLIKKVQKYE